MPAPMKLFKETANRRIIAFERGTQTVDVGNLNPQGKAVLSNANTSFSVLATQYAQAGIFIGLDTTGTPKISAVGNTGSLLFDGNNLTISGTITALAGVINGDLQIGTGGDIRSGMTSYLTGIGFCMDYNAGVPRFSIGNPAGDFFAFNGTNVFGNILAGSFVTLTSLLQDDGNLGVTADFTHITTLPPTCAVAAFAGMMTDAQTTIPNASDVGMVLRRDNGGTIYCGYQYTGETNVIALGGTDMFPAGGNIALGTSYATIGNTVNIPNPGQSVTVAVSASFGFLLAAAGTANSPINGQIQISFDGGSTWTTSTGNATASPPVTTHTNGSSTCFFMKSGTPTGDIQVRVQAQCTAGNGLMAAGASGIEIRVFQNSTYSIAGNLSSTIPGTATFNCQSTYPTSSCTATKNLTCAAGGGKPAYTYAWAKVSGTGTLSGTTTRIVTITDTETTTTGGATHNTTVNCAVTDTQSYATNAGGTGESWLTGTATLTIGAHSIPVGATVNVSGVTSGGPGSYNGTALVITGVTATTIQYAVASNPGAVTVHGTVNNVTVTSGNCVATGTFTLVYPAVTNNLTGKPTACGGALHTTCTSSGTIANNPAGGDGSYTYSNTKTAGTYTLSGSTTRTFTVSEGGTIIWSDTGTAKGTITDGHSNTGNASLNLSFSGFSTN